MKQSVFILLFAFSLITFTPLLYAYMPSSYITCETECCVVEESASSTCDMEDMECPGVCTPVQCILCCFLCPVNAEKIIVRVFDSSFNTPSVAGQFLLSGFSSECWQPPEIA